MLRPAPMELFSVVILDRDLHEVTEMLVRREALHLVRIKELEDWAQGLELVETGDIQNRCQDIQKRVQELLTNLKVSVDGAQSVEFDSSGLNVDKILQQLTSIEEQLLPKCHEKEKLLAQLKDRQNIMDQLDTLGPADIGSFAKNNYTFLQVIAGKIDSRNLVLLEKGLALLPHVVLPFKNEGIQTKILVMVLKKDASILEKVLAQAAVERIVVPQEALQGPQKAKLEEEIKALDARIAEDGNRFTPELLGLFSQSSAAAVIANAQSYFHKTGRTYLISGWMPKVRSEQIINDIKKIAGERCFLHEERPENVTAIREKKEKVPVLLDNPDLIKPFEMIVTNFGIPEYTSVDPTLFVAISFLIMFGAMFGDVGQGLVLFAAGVILTKQHRSLVSRVGFLMTYCGAAATVFGLLYGDFFGMEGIMPALWMNPFHNMLSFLPIAVGLGIVFISFGIGINIVNAVRAKDISKIIFGKTGLIGGLIYWIGVALAVRYFAFKAGPLPLGWVVLLMGVPVFLLFLKAPLEEIISKRGRMFQEGFLTYFIETVIEVMEIFTGYLANTLSYIRVAAFALAHAGLFLAVFTLADLIKHTVMGSVGSMLIVILGNIFIFVFEGMIVAIQVIRLEYYEFFSKFFEGEGKLYRPIRFGLQS